MTTSEGKNGLSVFKNCLYVTEQSPEGESDSRREEWQGSERGGRVFRDLIHTENVSSAFVWRRDAPKTQQRTLTVKPLEFADEFTSVDVVEERQEVHLSGSRLGSVRAACTVPASHSALNRH